MVCATGHNHRKRRAQVNSRTQHALRTARETAVLRLHLVFETQNPWRVLFVGVAKRQHLCCVIRADFDTRYRIIIVFGTVARCYGVPIRLNTFELWLLSTFRLVSLPPCILINSKQMSQRSHTSTPGSAVSDAGVKYDTAVSKHALALYRASFESVHYTSQCKLHRANSSHAHQPGVYSSQKHRKYLCCAKKKKKVESCSSICFCFVRHLLPGNRYGTWILCWHRCWHQNLHACMSSRSLRQLFKALKGQAGVRLMTNNCYYSLCSNVEAAIACVFGSHADFHSLSFLLTQCEWCASHDVQECRRDADNLPTERRCMAFATILVALFCERWTLQMTYFRHFLHISTTTSVLRAKRKSNKWSPNAMNIHFILAWNCELIFISNLSGNTSGIFISAASSWHHLFAVLAIFTRRDECKRHRFQRPSAPLHVCAATHTAEWIHWIFNTICMLALANKCNCCTSHRMIDIECTGTQYIMSWKMCARSKKKKQFEIKIASSEKDERRLKGTDTDTYDSANDAYEITKLMNKWKKWKQIATENK